MECKELGMMSRLLIINVREEDTSNKSNTIRHNVKTKIDKDDEVHDRDAYSYGKHIIS